MHVMPVFEKGFGSQLMLPLGGSTRQQMLVYIEEKAKKILVVDEYNAVIRHIKQVYIDDMTAQGYAWMSKISWR